MGLARLLPFAVDMAIKMAQPDKPAVALIKKVAGETLAAAQLTNLVIPGPQEKEEKEIE